jgi:hypothetical protein
LSKSGPEDPVHRGSPFITNLRLQWLALRRWKIQQGLQPIEALTVQLLGTVDDLVPPDDNLDLVTGKNFVYRTMPFSGWAILGQQTLIYGSEKVTRKVILSA